jgi:adenosylhomocysteine nucleosidase
MERTERRVGRCGLLVALPRELGPLAAGARTLSAVRGFELLELAVRDAAGAPLLAAVAGVGKVRAARAATLLIEAGVERALLVVGVCGALRRRERVGDLVHCARAVQADLALRSEREREPDAQLAAAWREVAPGPSGWFLTADRPVLSPWRRLRLARAYLGACVADMETAAAAWVAAEAGVPWAALRAVSDDVGFGPAHGFARNFPAQAGRAAATVPALLERLDAAPPSP